MYNKLTVFINMITMYYTYNGSLYNSIRKYCVQQLYTVESAIYRFDIDRFSACTVRNFWSRIKFHINNVIFFRIHRSPNYRFSALIICKSRSRRSIFRMDRLKKKIEAKYLLMALPSLWTIHLATQ